ncbi:MAG: hypothetical protein IJ150_10730, partial [Bacteroidales bacterium]|nr:hypothetical protein [Bacteroidales bacterium]
MKQIILTFIFAVLAFVNTAFTQTDEPDYLCFEVEAGTTIGLSKLNITTSGAGGKFLFNDNVDIQYSYDKINWYPLKYNVINVDTDCLIYFKGRNTCFYKKVDGNTLAVRFDVSKPFKCSGNIMTLVDEIGETTTLEDEYAFAHLFAGSPIMTAPKLPALTLSNYCYSYMFHSCRNLTVAPELPATTLSDYCYSCMFYGCDNLITAPKLPAIKLSPGCYHNMFMACYKLISAPKLPATIMTSDCYHGMFASCDHLLIAPELPATTLAEKCYKDMFSYCTRLKTTPVLPAKELNDGCYDGMFYYCSNLEKVAPILFETPNSSSTITAYWRVMFSNCNKLKYISVRFDKWWKTRQIINPYYEDYEDIYITKQWVKYISNEKGIFVCPATLPKQYGENFIPYGWTVKSLDEIIGYNIRVTESSKDYITTSETMEIEAGSKIHIAVINRTSEGYTISNIYAIDDNQNQIAIENEGDVYSFTMPAEDVTISVTYAPIKYTITTDDYSSVEENEVSAGETVNVSFSQRDGYTLSSAKFNNTALTISNNAATFTMPAKNVS